MVSVLPAEPSILLFPNYSLPEYVVECCTLADAVVLSFVTTTFTPAEVLSSFFPIEVTTNILPIYSFPGE